MAIKTPNTCIHIEKPHFFICLKRLKQVKKLNFSSNDNFEGVKKV
jgi:hypothetical protein